VALALDDKKAIVAEVAQVANGALSVVAAEYRGMTVAQMTSLRAKARTTGVYLRVIRNTLARRALAGTEFECMQDSLLGPLVLAFAQEDPGSSARLMKDFAKDCEALKVTALSIGGKLLAPHELDLLAKMPTKPEAIARLMSVMQAPIAKFVRTLNEPHAKFVRTLAAVRDKKQSEAA